MSSKRVYIAMCGLLGLLIIALVGGAYGVNSLFEKQAAKLTKSKSKVASLETQKQDLAKAKRDIIQYDNLYKITKAVVPENKDQAETVRQIVNIANKNHVTIGSITFPASTLGTTPGGGGAAATANSLVPKPSTVDPTTGKPNLSQLQAVPSIPGVYVLQINLTGSAQGYTGSDGKPVQAYTQIINMLDGLERNRQTAQVTNISITPSQETAGYTLNLTVNSYIKP